METSQVLHSTDQTQNVQPATGGRRVSRVRRVAVVAVLAGCAIGGVTIQGTTATDQLSPSVASLNVIAMPAARNSAQTEPARSAAEYYLPALHTNQAKSNDGNVKTYEHD